MTTDDLLTQGIAALNEGRKAQARSLLMRVVQQDERNEMAWLWLSGAVDTDEDRRTCLENALAINPNNASAQRGIEALHTAVVQPRIPDRQGERKLTTQSSSRQPRSQSSSVLQKFLNEEQDPAIVKQVYTRVSQILTSGEEILYIAVQNKPIVNIAPDCVVLTNRRFIIYRPKLLGRVEFEDYIWRDLHDARLKEGIMSATITMLTVKGDRKSVV